MASVPHSDVLRPAGRTPRSPSELRRQGRANARCPFAAFRARPYRNAGQHLEALEHGEQVKQAERPAVAFDSGRGEEGVPRAPGPLWMVVLDDPRPPCCVIEWVGEACALQVEKGDNGAVADEHIDWGEIAMREDGLDMPELDGDPLDRPAEPA
jgi:hypothetical protein